MRKLVLTSVLLLFGFAAQGGTAELYKTTLLRAAPGKLLALIDLLQSRQALYVRSGDQPPFMMRHSQGDQWDLLLLAPMSSYEEFYRPERVGARRQFADEWKDYERQLQALVAYREDIFVFGAAVGEVQKAFAGAGFFHVEIFRALPGMHEALYKQREMENAYLAALGRPQNLIFTRSQGGPWDVYTIGFYRDLSHFADSAKIPGAAEERAAQAAGFEAASRIGTYLRTLIQEHHDTLAVPVK